MIYKFTKMINISKGLKASIAIHACILIAMFFIHLTTTNTKINKKPLLKKIELQIINTKNKNSKKIIGKPKVSLDSKTKTELIHALKKANSKKQDKIIIASKKPKFRRVAHATSTAAQKGSIIGQGKITQSLSKSNIKNLDNPKQKLRIANDPKKSDQTKIAKGQNIVDKTKITSFLSSRLKNLQNVARRPRVAKTKQKTPLPKIKINPRKVTKRSKITKNKSSSNDELQEHDLIQPIKMLSPQEMLYIKNQFSKHWTFLSGQIPSTYKTVTLMLWMDIDGKINKAEVKKDKSINQQQYDLMVASALNAIKKISVLKLPKDKFKIWKKIQVTFIPDNMK